MRLKDGGLRQKEIGKENEAFAEVTGSERRCVLLGSRKSKQLPPVSYDSIESRGLKTPRLFMGDHNLAYGRRRATSSRGLNTTVLEK